MVAEGEGSVLVCVDANANLTSIPVVLLISTVDGEALGELGGGNVCLAWTGRHPVPQAGMTQAEVLANISCYNVSLLHYKTRIVYHANQHMGSCFRRKRAGNRDCMNCTSLRAHV